jgi:hypothetical protein
MEKAEQDAALLRRPKWDSEAVDIDELMRTTVGEGEISFSKLTKGPITSREVSQDEINKIAADALRRMNGEGDDFRKTDDIEPAEEDDDQEIVIPPDDQVKADIAFLKAKLAEGVSLWEYTSDVLESDYARGIALRRALAFLCDQRPELLDAA